MFCREHAAQLVPVRAELYREEAVTLSSQQVAQVRLSDHHAFCFVFVCFLWFVSCFVALFCLVELPKTFAWLTWPVSFGHGLVSFSHIL